jgi:hypothetical protein
MAINLISNIEPKNSGSFGILEDKYFIGGYRVVSDITERNELSATPLRIKNGMMVYVSGTNETYRWLSPSWNLEVVSVSGTVDLGEIPTLSANWNSTYTIVQTNSANWNGTYTAVSPNSANWNSAYNKVATVGNLSEITSNVLTINGGTNAVMGAGATIQVTKADASNSGYLLNTDWSSFNNKYNGLPTQTGNAGFYLKTNGATETWEPVSGVGGINGYTDVAFASQSSINVLHGFGTYPLVNVLDYNHNVIGPHTIVHNSVNDLTVTFTYPESGHILLSVGSPNVAAIAGKSSDYIIQTSDTVIVATNTITITLPNAVLIPGKYFTVKNGTVSDVVTLSTYGTQTIDLSATFLIGGYAALQIISDGANWWII